MLPASVHVMVINAFKGTRQSGNMPGMQWREIQV
jgi:hypothetical protein